MRNYKWKTTILILALFGGALAGCRPKEKTPLVVFAAGSLMIPFAELEEAFEAQNPDIDVLGEYHGSIQVIRHVTDIHEEIDVVASADHALIPYLMYENEDPESGMPYADWSVKFATNHLALAYTDGSLYGDEITPDNWHEILTRPDVKLGLSDPRFDAAGYRTLMVFKLGEDVYDEPALFFDVFGAAFRYPIKAEQNGEGWLLRVPEILETRPGAPVVMRGSSIQLISLLESGDIDYAFEYESVIQQHDLNMLRLPAELNLGEEDSESFYNRIRVLLDFQRFASIKPEFMGEQIAYGLTIPSNAPHPAEAARFVAFLLGEEGRRIMNENHHPMLDPLMVDNPQNLPQELQQQLNP